MAPRRIPGAGQPHANALVPGLQSYDEPGHAFHGLAALPANLLSADMSNPEHLKFPIAIEISMHPDEPSPTVRDPDHLEASNHSQVTYAYLEKVPAARPLLRPPRAFHARLRAGRRWRPLAEGGCAENQCTWRG
jgi:hypothetical protein